jgi:hypothetical protein
LLALRFGFAAEAVVASAMAKALPIVIAASRQLEIFVIVLKDVCIFYFRFVRGLLGMIIPGGRDCGYVSSSQPRFRATCKLIPVEEGEGDTA